MIDTSLEVQLAVISTQMGFIQQELAEAKTARKGQYEKMEEQSLVLATVESRLKKVEESLAEQAPTIEEFIAIKHKVLGAGLAGRWLWVFMAMLIGYAYSMRAEIFRWLARN